MKQRETVNDLAHAIEAKNEAAAQSLAAQILEQEPTLLEVLFAQFGGERLSAF